MEQTTFPPLLNVVSELPEWCDRFMPGCCVMVIPVMNFLLVSGHRCRQRRNGAPVWDRLWMIASSYA